MQAILASIHNQFIVKKLTAPDAIKVLMQEHPGAPWAKP